MSYKTQGIISSVKWEPTCEKLAITVNPTVPYRFEEKTTDKTEVFILIDDAGTLHKVNSDTTLSVPTSDPRASFAALLMLQLNRTKVEIIGDLTAPDYPVSSIEVK